LGFLYLTSVPVWEQLSPPESCAKRHPNRRCYHHIEMKPQTIGRVLGIGVRVAGRVVGQRITASAQTATSAPTAGQRTGRPTVNHAARGRTAGQATRGLARGIGGFLRPFSRIGGILWLEVTGVFFLVPVVVFAPTLWRTRASYAHGPDHLKFLLAAGLTAIFLYLGASSFWRARRK
jgi:hypothetical protein